MSIISSTFCTKLYRECQVKSKVNLKSSKSIKNNDVSIITKQYTYQIEICIKTKHDKRVPKTKHFVMKITSAQQNQFLHSNNTQKHRNVVGFPEKNARHK